MSSLLFPLQILRQYDAPVDVDMYFTTDAEMATYLTNARRYAGQIVTCGEQEGKVFILNNSKDEWLEVSGGGSGISGNIDGGLSNSIYLDTQFLDGGNSSSTY